MKNLSFPELVLLFLPLLLLTGPALPDISIVLIGIYFIFKSFKNQKIIFYNKNFFFIGLTFSFYLIINSVFKGHFWFSVENEGSVFYFRYIFFVAGFVYLFNKNPKLLNYFFYIFLIINTFVTIDGFIQFITGKNIFGWESSWDGLRLSGIFKDELIIGSFISKTTTLIIGLYFLSDKLKREINVRYIYIFLVIELIFIFVSGERAAFLSIALFYLFLILLKNDYKIFNLILSIILILLLVVSLNLFDNVGDRFIQTINSINSNKLQFMPYTPAHEAHYISALRMFIDYPIFGIGTNLFEIYCTQKPYFVESSCASHPHNIYMQILAENGLVGFTFLFGFFIFLVCLIFNNSLFKYSSRFILKDCQIPIVLANLVNFWPLIPHQSFYNNWSNVLIYISFSVLIYSYSKN